MAANRTLAEVLDALADAEAAMQSATRRVELLGEVRRCALAFVVDPTDEIKRGLLAAAILECDAASSDT